MAQIFHRSTNTFSRITIYGAVFVLAFLTWAFATLDRSGYETRQGDAARTARAVQPCAPRRRIGHRLPLLPHHRRDIQLRQYSAHQDLHELPFADLDRTSPTLEPVRESFRTDNPSRWTRVHDLPDYVYFNHSIHVNKGVGCETLPRPRGQNAADVAAELAADGVVPRIATAIPSSMCGPAMQCSPWAMSRTEDQEDAGRRLVEEYNIQDVRALTSCSTCHR